PPLRLASSRVPLPPPALFLLPGTSHPPSLRSCFPLVLPLSPPPSLLLPLLPIFPLPRPSRPHPPSVDLSLFLISRHFRAKAAKQRRDRNGCVWKRAKAPYFVTSVQGGGRQVVMLNKNTFRIEL
ncbi:hypothetical protein Naga_101541g2, partial [Nannochloropsis gaditana]